MPIVPGKSRLRLWRSAAVAALFLASTFGIHGQRHRALLSMDLQRFEARHASSAARVIVRGSRAEIDALADRHHLAVARYMSDSAVLLANSAQVTELASDSAQQILSGDLPVAPFMSVSNSSTAADQVRSGTSGLLLGIGGIPGVNGQGVTV